MTSSKLILQTSTLGSGYQSDEEVMARHRHRNSNYYCNSKNNFYYSREDFREQYCINERSLNDFNTRSRSTSFLFGCLSNYQDSPCKNRSKSGENVFTSCYGRSNDNYQVIRQRPYNNGLWDQQHPYLSDNEYTPPPHHYHYHHHHHHIPPHGFSSGFSSGDEGGFSDSSGPISTARLRSTYSNDFSAPNTSQTTSCTTTTAPISGGQPGAPATSTASSSNVPTPISTNNSTSIKTPRGEYNKRFTWDEQLERYVELPRRTHTTATRYSSAPPSHHIHSSAPFHQQQAPQGPQPQHSIARKHVSFVDNGTCTSTQSLARSATALSFDEQKMKRINAQQIIQNQLMVSSQERLLDGRKTPTYFWDSGFINKKMTASQTNLHHGTMKSQATQTETFIVRAGGPPPYLSLSPRTSQRTRMISQGAQTNGPLLPVQGQGKMMSQKMNSTPHLMTRYNLTSSDEEGDGEDNYEDDDDEEEELNFLINNKKKYGRTPLQKTLSDGEILLERKKAVTTAFLDVNLQSEDNQPFASNGYALARRSSLGSQSQPCTNNNLNQQRINELPVVKYRVRSNEDQFHEGMMMKISGAASAKTIGGKKIVSSLPGSPSSSTAGSYSLFDVIPPNKLRLSSLSVDDLASSTDNEEKIINHPNVIKPPVEFADNGFYFNKSGEDKDSVAMKATQSIVSLHVSLSDLSTIEDDDSGIYMEPYTYGIWIYIGESEELSVWRSRHEPLTRSSSGDSTCSEKEFSKKFMALTHRMVHRKASGETYRRLADNCLEINKRLGLIRSSCGEYGFRIHGSRPVVVSAVEKETPAEVSGLEVGDVIMSINGVPVLDSSHSDVVRIASMTDKLELELARTKDSFFKSSASTNSISSHIFQGALYKWQQHEQRSQQHYLRGKWVRRWFILRSDYCLSYYKSEQEEVQIALGAISLLHCCGVRVVEHYGGDIEQDGDKDGGDVDDPNVAKTDSKKTTFQPGIVFEIEKNMAPGTINEQKNFLRLASSDLANGYQWIHILDNAIAQAVQDDKWLAISGENVMKNASNIENSDCHGYIYKLGRRIKTWTRLYCVLKDACIYFFSHYESPTGLGAAHLHGYRVQTVSLGGKKNAFELVPPQNSMRHYYLATDSENDRKRWLAALEYSIDRWINLV